MIHAHANAGRRHWSANDRIRVAVAGLAGRGRAHVQAFASMPAVEVACLVDPDERTWASQIRAVERLTGTTPAVTPDVRWALDDPEIDVLAIATPDRWHAPMTIWACDAGKDVYVEKIFSHNVWEGRIAVEIACAKRRIVQHGAQRRSLARLGAVIDFISSGKHGRLRSARAICYRPRDCIGFQPLQVAPAKLNYDLWLGPASPRTYHDNLLNRNWHFFWDVGTGEVGAQAVHQLDVARWAMGDPDHPRRVSCVGGRFGYVDQAETPNTLVASYEFGDQELVLEIRGLPSDPYAGWVPSHLNHAKMVGNVFYLDGGVVVDEFFFANGSERPERIGPGEASGEDLHSRSLFDNFIQVVRHRRTEELISSPEQGHRSAVLCHLANISYRLGTPNQLREEEAPFQRSERANGAWRDTVAHLVDNNVDCSDTQYVVGEPLEFDAASETFVGAPEANALLVDTYRDPFTIPLANRTAALQQHGLGPEQRHEPVL